MNSICRVLVLIGAAALSTACASIKTPSVQVASLRLDGISLTGARIDVGLQIRNVNAQDLKIERFEYEIRLDGKTLGRGFQSEPLMLAGFKEDKVISRLDLNLLKIPGLVKGVLGQDRVSAEVKGIFYVREGSGLRELKFGSSGNVDLKKGPSN